MAKKVKPGKLRGNTTPNYLTKDANDYILQLEGGMAYSLHDIIQLVLLDGASSKTEQDLEESFRMVMQKGIEMSLMGNNVSLDYVQMRASVSGVFNSNTETFIRPKHEVNPVIVAGESYLEAAHTTLVENMGPMQNNIISKVLNHKSKKVNEDVSVGCVIEINGKGLKVVGSEEYQVRVMFMDASTNTVAAAVAEEDLLTNLPTQLMLQVPEGLEVGKKYTIKISTLYSNSSHLLKDPRMISSDIKLTAV